MERLKAKDEPGRKESKGTKVEIAKVNEKFTAKAAEREIFLKKQINEAEMGGNRRG